MKNKFGIISLIFSFLPWLILYLSTSNKLGTSFGFFLMLGYGLPFISIFILILFLLLTFCIRSIIFSLRSKEEFKGYPILAIIIIVPIFLIIAAVIFFFIQGMREAYFARSLNTNDQKSVQQTVENSNIEKVPVIDWKTYKNDEYGFQLKYPSDWKVQDLSYTYKGVKSPAVNIVSKLRYDLPSYQSQYVLQLSFFANKISIQSNNFIEISQVAQSVKEVSLSDSVLKSTQEYKDAQEIIKSVVCTSPLVCDLPK